MTNFTIALQESLLQEARKQAANDNTSLNAVVRDFLVQYAGRQRAVAEFDALHRQLGHVDAGRTFSRAEMNQR